PPPTAASQSLHKPTPLTDATGVVFAHPGRFRRIVSLAPSLTEEIFALGDGNALLADTIFGLYPAAARTKAKIGSTLAPDLGLIVSLHPDLVVATEDGNRRTTVEQLRRLGLRVFVVGQSSTFRDIKSNFRELGRLLGRESSARKVLREAERQVALVRTRVSQEPRVRVFFELQQTPLMSANDDTFIGEALRDAGATDILGAVAARYPRVSEESVLQSNPGAILVANEQADPARAVSDWTRFPSLSAARQRHIYLVPSHIFDSPTPTNFAAAVRIAAQLLHPEARP
ncbi:MAG: ABC transporter substrate-binding protein, partial [Terriglobales bacterium]